MKISSKSFKNNGNIPKKHTCEGEGISPELVIEDIPEEARSLVLMVDDPDVPSVLRKNNLWVHWLVWNIDPETSIIPEGGKPNGVYGMTTSDTLDFVPPCPPDREHRYVFKVFALNSLIDLEEGSTKEQLEKVIENKIIDRAELIGLYCKEENR